MLRVYSILYIEKLWNTSASPALKGVGSSHASVVEEEIPVVVQDDDISSLSVETIEPIVHLVGVPEEEEEEEDNEDEEEQHEIGNQFGGYTLDTVEIEQVNEQVEKLVEEVKKEEVESHQDTRRYSKVTFEEPPEHIEHAVRSLEIKPVEEENAAIVESVTSSSEDSDSASSHHEEEEEVIAADSVSSTTSSIVPPSTPPSTETSGHSEKPTSPRTTSLLRRETSKLNSRRKSLTNKLKRVLTVKSGATNKRNSVSLE